MLFIKKLIIRIFSKNSYFIIGSKRILPKLDDESMDNSINLLVNEEFSVYDKTSEIAIQRHGESKSKKAISKQDLSIKKFDKINGI